MRKISYWELRKAQRMYEYMEDAEKAAEQISNVYFKASRYISLELEQIFDKYRNKHGLTEDQARELLSHLEDRTSLDELKRVLENSDKTADKQEILSKLDAPAYQARMRRLVDLQQKIDTTMQSIYKQEKQHDTDFFTRLAEDVYYKSIFDTQKRTGLAFSFNYIDPKLISKVINTNWSGNNYSSRIWRNTSQLAQDLKEELLISLLTGRTYRETEDIFVHKYGQGAFKARRLIRTESCYISNQMEIESYEECGFLSYFFVAVLDLITSKTCRKLDGKRFRVKKQIPGKNCPPMHPFCRSTTIAGISKKELAALKRRAYNPDTGKTMLIPADTNFQEWYTKYVLKE